MYTEGSGQIIFPHIHEKTIPPGPRVFLGCPEVCSVLTRRKGHVSRAILKLERLEVSVTGAKKRLKIPLLFLTSETLNFESGHFFESHKHLQSAADMILVLTSF